MIAAVLIALPLLLAQKPPTASQIGREVGPWFKGSCRSQPVPDSGTKWNFLCGTAKGLPGALEVSLSALDERAIHDLIEILQKVARELRLMGSEDGQTNPPVFRWLGSEEHLSSGRLIFFSVFPPPGRFIAIDPQTSQILVLRYVEKDPILHMQPRDESMIDGLFEQMHNAGLSLEKRVWRKLRR